MGKERWCTWKLGADSFLTAADFTASALLDILFKKESRDERI
jgi:hypothetical protein